MLSTGKSESSQNPKESELDNYPTAGEGDCAFHAARGEWDGKQFYCKNVAELRLKMGEKVRNCQPGDPIYNAAKEAIQQIIIAESKGKKAFHEARLKYHLYLATNSYLINEAWNNFEVELKKRTSVLNYIADTIPEKLKTQSLKQQFDHCLNEDNDNLRARIFSLPNLATLYKKYMVEITKGFNLDDLLKNKALWEEYAALLERQDYWLLASELEIMARTLNVTIKYYLKLKGKSQAKTLQKIYTYNPNNNVVAIYFDGRGHYERVDVKDKYPKKAQSFSLSQSSSQVDLSNSQSSSSLSSNVEYKGAGLKNTLHGNIYQLKLLMLFLKRALENQYVYELRTEDVAADKFDDIVFKYQPVNKKSAKWRYRYLQAKHNFDNSRKITSDQLLNQDDNDFCLQKYFVSYCRIKKEHKDGELIDFTICTNIGFMQSIKTDFDKIEQIDDIINVNVNDKVAKASGRYILKKKSNLRKQVFKLLKGNSDLRLLGELLAGNIVDNKKIELRHYLIKKYHMWLAQEVFDVTEGSFLSAFLDDDRLSLQAHDFREIILEKVLKLLEAKGETVNREEQWQSFYTKKFEFSGSFGKKGDQVTPSDEVSDEDINDFLDKLVFAVDQPYERELETIIEAELGEQFNLINADLIASNFQRELLNWMKDKESKVHTDKEGQQFFEGLRQKIDQLILVGPTLEYCAMLEDSKVTFKCQSTLTDFLTSNKKQILVYLAPQSTLLASIKVYQALQSTAAYRREGAYIYVKVDTFLNLKKRLTNAFEAKSCGLLVIECDKKIIHENATIIYKTLQSILKDNQAKKLILITQQRGKLTTLFKNELSYSEEVDSKNNFSDLLENSKILIKDKRVIFQGRMLKLGDLVTDSELNDIAPEALVELMSTKEIVVDLEPTPLTPFEASCYVPRTLSRLTALRPACLQENIADVFVVSGLDKKGLQKLVGNEEIKNFDDKNKDDNKPARFILLNHNVEEMQFTEVIRTFSKRNVHWIYQKDHQGKKIWVWIRSSGSVSGLRGYLLDTPYQTNAQIPNEILIVSAEPGMGKTTTIDHWMEKEKAQDERCWVIKFDLKAKKHFIESMDFSNLRDVSNFMAMALGLTLLSGSLLHACLEKRGNIIRIYIDGFDEISSDCQTKVIKFLQILQRDTKVAKVLIATRQHMQQNLEDALGTFAYSLTPFSEANRAEYLRKYWERNLNIQIFSENEIDKFYKFIDRLFKLLGDSIKDPKLKFMGIPLQARLLAEAFQNDFARYYTADEEVDLPEKIELVDLYQKILSEKLAIYLRDKESIEVYLKTSHKDILMRSLMKAHQRLALEILFGQEAENFFGKQERKYTLPELEKVGMLQCVGSESAFVHRTFAEYLVATFLIDGLKKPKNDHHHAKVMEFLLLHIFKSRNEVVRRFMANLVIRENNPILKQHWQQITAANLLDSKVTDEEEYGGTHIAEYVKEKKEEKEEDQPELSFEEKLENIRKLEGRTISNENMVSLKNFIGELFRIANLQYLKQALEILYMLANSHRYNHLKLLIMRNANAIIKHYLEQSFIQGKRTEIRKDLMKNFSTVKSNKNVDNRGQIIADYVDSEIISIKKTLAIYLKFDNLTEADIKKSSFWQSLNEEGILFLRCSNYFIDRKQLEHLKLNFSKFPQNSDAKKACVELFLQIAESDATLVKDYLITVEEWPTLVKLFAKFPTLRLSIQDVRRIYRNEKESRNMFWLERTGVTISRDLAYLTPEMSKYFLTVLNDESINGCHTIYAGKIFYELLLPLTDLLWSGSANHITRHSLIEIFAEFVNFSVNQHMNVTLNPKQLETIFRIVEGIFNNALVSSGILEVNIKSLLFILKAFRLQLIEMDGKLLVLEPKTDFNFMLKLDHKRHLIKVLKQKIANPNNSITHECEEAIREMFPLNTTNSLISNYGRRGADTLRNQSQLQQRPNNILDFT